MPIAPNGLLTAEIVVRGLSASAGSTTSPSVNIFHYKRRTTVVNASKAALNNAFQAAIIAPVLAAMSSRYSPILASIRFLEDATDPYQDFVVAGSGAIATDSTNTHNAVYMLLRTGLRGKSYRGSKHFGPLSEVDTTGDVLTGAGLGRWQSLQTALATALVDASPNTWDLSVVSRKLSQLVINPTTVIVNPISAVLLNLTVGSMKSRRARTVR